MKKFVLQGARSVTYTRDDDHARVESLSWDCLLRTWWLSVVLVCLRFGLIVLPISGSFARAETLGLSCSMQLIVHLPALFVSSLFDRVPGLCPGFSGQGKKKTFTWNSSGVFQSSNHQDLQLTPGPFSAFRVFMLRATLEFPPPLAILF